MIARCVECATAARNGLPPAGAGIDTIAAHVTIRRNAAEDDDRRRASRTTHLVGRYFNEDFSIIKRTRLFESRAIVFKAELFNAFNRHVFGRPDAGPKDGTFGANFGTVNGPRNVQFTLRFDF